MSDEIHDLAGAYALNALPDDERRVFESHLEGCVRCRDEVAELRAAAAALGAEERAEPPAALKERILAEVAAGVPQEAPSPGAQPEDTAAVRRVARRRAGTTRPWYVRALAPAVAVLVIAVVALGIGVLSLDDRVDRAEAVRELLGAPDAALVALEGDRPGTARFLYSGTDGRGVFLADGFTPVGPDETYQLWLIGPDGPLPAGLFRPSDGTATVIVTGDLRPGDALGVTVEAARGSEVPTGPIIWLANLS